MIYYLIEEIGSVKWSLEDVALWYAQDLLHVLYDLDCCRGSETKDGNLGELALHDAQEFIVCN